MAVAHRNSQQLWYLHKTYLHRIKPVKNPGIYVRGAIEVPPLAEGLLAVDGWGQGVMK